MVILRKQSIFELDVSVQYVEIVQIVQSTDQLPEKRACFMLLQLPCDAILQQIQQRGVLQELCYDIYLRKRHSYRVRGFYCFDKVNYVWVV